MAYERISDQKTRGEGFDVFIDNTMKLFSNQLAIRNAEEENNFNRIVVEQSLSLADQLDYRKEQLKRVGDDKNERKRLREEIKTLSSLVEQQGFSDEYLQKLADSEAGITSIDSVISWLNDQKLNTTNPEILASIGKSIVERQRDKFTLTQSLLTNQTNYALKDKTESIINSQITRVSAERTKALLGGNDLLVSGYDLQIQSLQKALNENVIDKEIKNFAVSTITGYASATQLLDAYNGKISSSASVGPVKIGDVTYQSSQEFWKFKRDSFLADNSDAGFFTRFNNELNTNIKVKNSQNTLTNEDLKSAAAKYDALLSRPELVNYQFRVSSTKQDTLQTGADFLSKNILNRYQSDFDINRALNDVNVIKNLGANVNDAYYGILNVGGANKKTQVDNILQAAQTILLNNPQMTAEQALNEAMKSGAAGILSPSQYVTKPAENIVKEGAAAATAGTFGTDTRTTVAPTTPGAPQDVPPVVPPTQQNQTSAIPAAPAPAPAILFSKQLDFGATDPQVKELQKFLNTQGFKVSATGEGSPGFETDYFGPLTQKALQKFQSAQGIVSTGDALTTGYGRLGPQTLTAINKLLGVK